MVNQVAIIGGGLMGSGIAQNAAEHGNHVTIIEVSAQAAEQSVASIKNQLQRKVQKERISQQEMEGTLGRVSTAIGFEHIKSADIIIEAVPEKLELKQEVFRQLDVYASENATLASNTSGLSIAAIGSVTRRPEKVIGFHYFYPVPAMKLIEVVPSIITDQSTVEKMRGFAEGLNKRPILCQDYPGFLVNRILIPMVNEAIYCVMEGAAAEDVDDAMKLGANLKMGPIALADFVGLDTLLSTMEGLYEGYSDSKYRPCPLLKKVVESGNLGLKTGRGFFQYDESGKKITKEGIIS
ncbi:3-hydroxyacyl-CoA dehydrogenase family protein [Shouchella shacheensis]|uniref:3-hydroxyacyl-CoA dehydrogenase family protein n=1 Tax=Shouchella shacheensis TaxID=1649580 RepID=UPI0007403FA1|nr:3-hydroxyacyl-CoA dehydrogenase NAD-binding domain-containing protein [Shouchella shacheensis]